MSSSSVQQQGEQRLGKPVLTTLDAIAQSMAIGPVFSAVALGALIAGAAGKGSTFVTVLGLIAALCTGWVLSVYARKYAGAGAAYEYLRRAGGNKVLRCDLQVVDRAVAGGFFLDGRTAVQLDLQGVVLYAPERAEIAQSDALGERVNVHLLKVVFLLRRGRVSEKAVLGDLRH